MDKPGIDFPAFSERNIRLTPINSTVYVSIEKLGPSQIRGTAASFKETTDRKSCRSSIRISASQVQLDLGAWLLLRYA